MSREYTNDALVNATESIAKSCEVLIWNDLSTMNGCCGPFFFLL
jgi:hypothetical protein